MDYIINLVGFGNSVWILLSRSKRKFFCVCDKITIGDRTPQCMMGAFCHLVSILFILLSQDGLAFYPISLWVFALLLSSMYTYKSVRELCLGCVTAFLTSILALVIGYSKLGYVPWIVITFYVSVIMLALCLTSASLKVKA